MMHEMYLSIKFYGVRHQITSTWDDAQSRFKCCGVKAFRDWYAAIPASCCANTEEFREGTCQNAYVSGCYDVSLDFIRASSAEIVAYDFNFAFIMIFGLIFSCVFFSLIE